MNTNNDLSEYRFVEEGSAFSKIRDTNGQIATGAVVISLYLRNLPDNQPGVYRMVDINDTVLYIGKAKCLKSRVSNYTRMNGHSKRIQIVISRTAYMIFLMSDTEAEALLLEASLIRQLRPVYNILLRDDKSFPYIVINNSPFPRIMKYRGKKPKGKSFGPFASSSAADQTLKHIQKIFQLRNCSDDVFYNRSRPCLLHQIKLCSAPCTNMISEQEYKTSADQAAQFLRGKNTSLHSQLIQEMKEKSDNLDFEQAAVLRDRINAIDKIHSHHSVSSGSISDFDVIAIDNKSLDVCVEVMFFRFGQNRGNRAFFPRIYAETSDEEIISSFILQFYQSNCPPPTIYVSVIPSDINIIQQALQLSHNMKNISITVPKKGKKRRLLQQAILNAKDVLRRYLTEKNSFSNRNIQLRELIKLEKTPSRIEVYDNSHIQGNANVGVMIVAGSNGFIKSEYRKFQLQCKNYTPGDDFAGMREVLLRRFTKSNTQTPEPDLILIDGGDLQLRAVYSILQELNMLHIPLVGIAKGLKRNAGDETLYFIDRPAFKPEKNHPALYHLQCLRDEAHRFAISYHRKLRTSSAFACSLDKIPNIGKIRKKNLLTYFTSIQEISNASIDDLILVPGITLNIAKKILLYLRMDNK